MLRCLVVDDDPLARLVLERFVAQDADLQLVGSCSSAIEAAALLRREPVDLLFLDVEMPGMSGLEMLDALAASLDVVLVTGSREYAVDAFDAGVADYLVKPVAHARFLKCLERVRARRGRQTPGDRWIFVRRDRALVRLDLADIRRIEAERDVVILHTTKGPYRVPATMQSMEARLPSGDFIRVHRSHIVRLDLVVDFEDDSLVIGKDVIPVGESYRAGLLARIRAP